MNEKLITCLVIAIAFSFVASIPLERRLPDSDSTNDEEARTEKLNASITTEAATKTKCAPQTPCGWAIYKPEYKMIEYNFTNSYCDCDDDKYCIQGDDDTAVSAYVFFCRTIDLSNIDEDLMILEKNMGTQKKETQENKNLNVNKNS